MTFDISHMIPPPYQPYPIEDAEHVRESLANDETAPDLFDVGFVLSIYSGPKIE